MSTETRSDGPERWLQVAAVVALLTVATIVRLSSLDSAPVHWDEGVHAYYAWEFLTEGTFTYEPWRHGPLLYYVSAPAMAVFGEHVAVGRAIVAALSLGLLVAVYLLREDLPRPALWFAATILAFHPFVLATARFFRNDALLATLVLLGIGLYARYRRTPSAALGVGLGATLGLALATKEAVYLLLPPVVLAIAVVAHFDGRFHDRARTALLSRYVPLANAPAALIAFVAVVVVLFGSWPLDLAGIPSRLAESLTYWLEEGRAEEGELTYYIDFLIGGAPVLVGLAAVGAVGTFLRTRSAWFRWLFLSWAVVPLAVLSLLGDQSWWNVVLVFPPIAVLAGCGGVDLVHAVGRLLGDRRQVIDRHGAGVTAIVVPVVAALLVITSGVAVVAGPGGVAGFDGPTDEPLAGPWLRTDDSTERDRAYAFARERAMETDCPTVVGPDAYRWPAGWWFRGLDGQRATDVDEVHEVIPAVVVNRGRLSGLDDAGHERRQFGKFVVYVPREPCGTGG